MIAQRAIDRAIRRFPWYDSVWLRRYVAAVEFIGHTHPGKLDMFVEALRPLRTRRDFRVQRLAGIFDAQRLQAIRQTVAGIPAATLEAQERQRFGRSVVHNYAPFTALQRELIPLVSEIVGEEVEARYNFLSLYSSAGVCEPHFDAPTTKWTLDICIEKTVAWPLFISQTIEWPETFSCENRDWRDTVLGDASLLFEPFDIEPGDGLVFSGSSQWHYRRPLDQPTRGDFCHLLFFHFLPAGMGEIASPKNWPLIFGIEELAWVVSARDAEFPDHRGELLVASRRPDEEVAD
jgi:hypothetical protein